MFVYDLKYDDLTKIAYSHLLLHDDKYRIKPSFYVINFDNLSASNRCNPLNPSSVHDITDATESARTILLELNRKWINKQGDFFVESPSTSLLQLFGFFENMKTEILYVTSCN